MGKVRVSQINVVPMGAATSTPLVGPSEKRVAIIIGIGATSAVAASNTVVNNRALASANDGLLLAASSPMLALTVEQHGSVVKMPWHGRSVNATNVGIVEVIEIDE